MPIKLVINSTIKKHAVIFDFDLPSGDLKYFRLDKSSNAEFDALYIRGLTTWILQLL